MKEYDQGSEGHRSTARFSLLYWECPRCQTVSTEPRCENCGYQPDYYLPVDPSELVLIDENSIASDLFAGPGNPHPVDARGVTDSQGKTWKCRRCGSVNDDRHPICQKCAASKPKKTTGLFIWLLVAIGIMVFVVAFVAMINRGGRSSPLQRNASGDQAFPAQVSTSNTVADPNRVYPNPPVEGCVLWTSISKSDAGSTLCVYGLVYDSYAADSKRYFLRFSDEKNTFRMVLMNGLKMDSSAGECVFQTGEIKEYSGVLYMESSEIPEVCDK